MKPPRRHLKRRIETGEALTLEGGRIVVLLERAGAVGTVSVRVDGVVMARRMVQHERRAFDGGRLEVEVERTFGRSAQLYLGLDDSLRIDKPK